MFPTVTCIRRNWFEPMLGPFPSRLLCQSNDDCHVGFKMVSIVLHSVGLAYAWSFLVVIDLLELTYAMHLTQTLEVPEHLRRVHSRQVLLVASFACRIGSKIENYLVLW